MAVASGANVSKLSDKVQISEPIADSMRAAERNDCEGEGMVDGYVAGHACDSVAV